MKLTAKSPENRAENCHKRKCHLSNHPFFRSYVSFRDEANSMIPEIYRSCWNSRYQESPSLRGCWRPLEPRLVHVQHPKLLPSVPPWDVDIFRVAKIARSRVFVFSGLLYIRCRVYLRCVGFFCPNVADSIGCVVNNSVSFRWWSWIFPDVSCCPVFWCC